MMDLFRAWALRQEPMDLPLDDEAVRFAVNLGAMVNNVLHAYEVAMLSGEYEPYVKQMYELSTDFHSPEAVAAREAMRKEWVRRCQRRNR